jgi:hypothetical protein
VQEVKPASWLDESFGYWGSSFGIVLFNFHERSELTSILTSEISVI